VVSQGRAGLRQRPAQLGQERDPAGEHHGARRRTLPGDRGGDEERGFEAYLEHVLAPTLSAGQIVVLDNLSSHKGGRVKEIVEQRGCELMYLPPYSPDLNPIEQAFSKVKGLMRKAEARTREALIEAMGRALDAVTSGDARGFFSHCGYRPMDQLI